MPIAKDPILTFKKAKDFGAWVARHHDTPTGILLAIAKKGSGLASLTYPEAVEVALMWGWIDGVGLKNDDKTWLQRFTRRRSRSIWSKINRDRATALITAGRMKPPGLLEVERAKADGRWASAYDSPKASRAPDDLIAALSKNKRARAFFEQLDASNRYAILHRVQTAKRPETRLRRIAQFVELLAARQTLHPPRKAAPRTALPRKAPSRRAASPKTTSRKALS